MSASEDKKNKPVTMPDVSYDNLQKQQEADLSNKGSTEVSGEKKAGGISRRRPEAAREL
jgi:hypothetical protein